MKPCRDVLLLCLDSKEEEDVDFEERRRWSLTMAAICSVYVIAATWPHSCTENWVVTYAKMGLTGKQLPCNTNLRCIL